MRAFLNRISLKSRRVFRFVKFVIWVSLILTIFYYSLFISDICEDYTNELNISLKTMKPKKYEFEDSNLGWTRIFFNYVSIYSAFLNNSNVTIISIISQKVNQINLYCSFTKLNNTHQIIFKSRALIKPFPENYKESKLFSAAKIMCYLPKELSSFANYVKLSALNSMDSTESVKIKRIINNNVINAVNVCVRPLFGPFSSISSLVEFIAYYRINGISKLFFYDLNITDAVKQFLNSLDFVELLPFKLTVNSKQIHASGQMASINDCLLRNTNYQILFVDIDEYIVAQKHRTLKDYINQKLNNHFLSSLVVPNIFFCHEFQNHHSFPSILSHDIRQTFHWKHGDRSKVIVFRPSTVETIGIHKVWSTIQGFISENGSQNEILLYHYRSCCHVRQEYFEWPHLNLYFYTLKDKLIRDQSMNRFREQILLFISDYVIF